MSAKANQSPHLRKAAVLLTSLPREQAASVLSRLSPKQVELVSIEIARLGRLSGDEQNGAMLDFAKANPHSVGGDVGSLDLAKALVQQALGKDAGSTLENVQQSIEALPFAFLRNVDPQNLLTFIIDEHPQTIALILSHLPPAYGAQVLAGLATDRQLAVIRRIAHMKQTNPEVIHEVESGLEVRMASVMSQSYQQAGGVPSVAEILNVADRATERALLEKLSQEDPELVEEIRRLMFVFEDLCKLADKDVQIVLRNVETSQWALALKSASQELKDKILGNMSQRAAQMLREEMEYLGPVRVSDVEQCQQKIVDVVRRLEDSGDVSLHADEGAEEFIS